MAKASAILVVEDEWLIADEIVRQLESQGRAVCGPVASVEAALDLIDQGGIDAALLDISLNGETSYPVAQALTAREIPFGFVTGYHASEIDPPFQDVTCLVKPIKAAHLAKTLERMLARPAPASKSEST